MKKKECWGERKQSKNISPKRDYFVNKEKGVSYWGKPTSDTDILPAGWEYVYSKSGKLFYYNHSSKKTTWEKPTEHDKLPLPKGWIEMRSKVCNNVYYMNYKTDETQWEYPTESRDNEGQKRFGISVGKRKKSPRRLYTSLTPESELKRQIAKLTKQNSELFRGREEQYLEEKKERDEALQDYKTIAREVLEDIKRKEKAEQAYEDLFQTANKQLRTERTRNNELHEQVRYLQPPKFNMGMDEDWYNTRKIVQKDIQVQKQELEGDYEELEKQLDDGDYEDHYLTDLDEEDRIREIQEIYEDEETDEDEDESPDYKTTSIDVNKKIQKLFSGTTTLPPSHYDSASDSENYDSAEDDSDFDKTYDSADTDFDPEAVETILKDKGLKTSSNIQHPNYETYTGEFGGRIDSKSGEVLSDFQDTSILPDSELDDEKYHDSPDTPPESDEDDENYKDFPKYISQENLEEEQMFKQLNQYGSSFQTDLYEIYANKPRFPPEHPLGLLS